MATLKQNRPHHLYLNFHLLKKSDICLNISNSTAMNYFRFVYSFKAPKLSRMLNFKE